MRQRALHANSDTDSDDDFRPRGNSPSRSGFSGWGGSEAGSSSKPGGKGAVDDKGKGATSTAPQVNLGNPLYNEKLSELGFARKKLEERAL
jgi:hypothetical protein